MSVENKWEWIPNKSLGVVCIGDNIKEHKQKLKLKKDHCDAWLKKYQENYEESYDLPNLETTIFVEHNIVFSITSWEEFNYKGVNLIGQKFSDLENILNCTPDDEESFDLDEGGIQRAYDYDDLGLQIWVRDSVIESATCGNYRASVGCAK